MFQSARALCTVLTLGIVIVECNARYGMDHDPRGREEIKESIECYECNSAYDPRCGDPFNPYTIGKVNCSMKRPLNHNIKVPPTLCRKTVQKVQGNIRVIRGCGYIPDDRDDKACLVRTGTHDVHVRYCACKHSLCNRGNVQSSPSRIALGATVLAITRLVQRA
ncbi:unnamed protein product [Tenebrio molitor]|jgi:hypothetical protein|nr:unnamed protein product [Tenebrio molitor]